MPNLVLPYLRGAVFNYLFANFGKARPFGYNRYIAVHFAINLYVFYHSFAVSL